MKKSFLMLTIFIFGATSFGGYSDTCQQKSVFKKYNTVIENLKEQTVNLDKILTGKIVDGRIFQILFGNDFDIEKTDLYIQKQREILNQQKGLLIEHFSLSECLNVLKEKEKEESLRKLTKDFISKKIQLLEKNQQYSDSIRETGMTESSLPEIKEKIDKDSSEALKVKESLEDSLMKKQTASMSEKSSEKREVLEYEGRLTKLKIELLNLKLETNKSLEEKILKFETSTLQLKELSRIEEDFDKSKLLQKYHKVEQLWFSLSSEKYFDLFKIYGSLNIPTVPAPLEQSKFDTDISFVLKFRTELIELRKEFIRSYTEKKNQELRLLNNLVASSNAIREDYYRSLGGIFFFSSLIQPETYQIIINEVVSAPYRAVSFFYSKYLYLREQISLGKEGIVNLIGKSFFIISFIILYYLFKYIFGQVNEGVDKIFEYLFRSKRRSFLLQKLLIIWKKLKDSSSALLWLLTLYLLQKYELVKSINLLIKIAEVYLGSIILKSFVNLFLGSISRLDTGSFKVFKIKANETSDRFKNIYLFYFFTMIFIEATVGRVYLFTLLNYFVVIYSLYHLIKESSRWEVEFRKFSEKMFSGIVVEKFFRILDFCPKSLRSSLLLVFIISFMIFNVLVGLTENFEISKKISANLFKKQIEKIEAEDGADGFIPVGYKDCFSFKSISDEDEYVHNAQGLEENILGEISEWIHGESDEHSLVVFGDKGVGKTTLLKRVGILLEGKEQLEVRYAKMPAKTITKSAINDFIATIFASDKSEGDFNIYNYDKELQYKIVVIIDECQNIFLSQTGGFDAYYILTNLINMNTKNIFWVMSFNKYSWLFLDRAFGRTQFFRNVFELSGWDDAKIKELIMKRHRKTNYRLSFDLLISATRSQDEIDKYASIESKFFKLLWELSRGNPRAALYLWMSALSRKSKNVFNVNVPKEAELNGIEHMPDELLFVIASVLKHENLSSLEIESTTNLQKGLVRNAIKLALEKKFFFKDERNRYMIDISIQHGLSKFLKVKNFIYGS